MAWQFLKNEVPYQYCKLTQIMSTCCWFLRQVAAFLLYDRWINGSNLSTCLLHDFIQVKSKFLTLCLGFFFLQALIVTEGQSTASQALRSWIQLGDDVDDGGGGGGGDIICSTVFIYW